MSQLFQRKRVGPVSTDAIKTKTGKPWEDWCKILDKAGARMMDHKEIVSYLNKQNGVAVWWSQVLATGYETERGMRPGLDGESPGHNCEIRLNKFVPAPKAAVWAAWQDPSALARWLPGVAFTVTKTVPQKTLHLDWPSRTRVIVRFYDRRGDTRLVLEQSGLAEEEIPRMQIYWTDTLDRLKILLAKIIRDTLVCYAEGNSSYGRGSSSVRAAAATVQRRRCARRCSVLIEDGWMPLLNGHDLAGWHTVGSGHNDWLTTSGIIWDRLLGPTRLSSVPGPGDRILNGLAGRTANLITDKKFGDIELYVEFMVAKGSNSGVYLHSLYEVQIFDSYGSSEPVTSSDGGGIYHRWIDNKGVGGSAPSRNACRRPGEWQSYHIWFRAPRFDASGKKTENGKYIRVVYNGLSVQNNVEVEGPTRAANNIPEAAENPVMLQGDHGPERPEYLLASRSEIIAVNRSGRGDASFTSQPPSTSNGRTGDIGRPVQDAERRPGWQTPRAFRCGQGRSAAPIALLFLWGQFLLLRPACR